VGVRLGVGRRVWLAERVCDGDRVGVTVGAPSAPAPAEGVAEAPRTTVEEATVAADSVHGRVVMQPAPPLADGSGKSAGTRKTATVGTVASVGADAQPVMVKDVLLVSGKELPGTGLGPNQHEPNSGLRRTYTPSSNPAGAAGRPVMVPVIGPAPPGPAGGTTMLMLVVEARTKVPVATRVPAGNVGGVGEPVTCNVRTTSGSG
jgi:hypothetical protein